MCLPVPLQCDVCNRAVRVQCPPYVCLMCGIFVRSVRVTFVHLSVHVWFLHLIRALAWFMCVSMVHMMYVSTCLCLYVWHACLMCVDVFCVRGGLMWYVCLCHDTCVGVVCVCTGVRCACLGKSGVCGVCTCVWSDMQKHLQGLKMISQGPLRRQPSLLRMEPGLRSTPNSSVGTEGRGGSTGRGWGERTGDLGENGL